jgi:hypothetical protein
MSWVGFNISEGNPFVFAVVAASTASIGQLVLARFCAVVDARAADARVRPGKHRCA